MMSTTFSEISDVATLLPSWLRHLRAANRSPNTIATYRDAVVAFHTFLVDRGMPTAVEAIRREHVEAFVEDVLARRRPRTADSRYRSVARFFKWAIEEGEITESPMRNMKPPTVPEEPVVVLSDDEVKRLLATTNGTDFEARRDAAVIRLFLDTGMRMSELAGLQVTDVDLEQQVAIVMGKGRRPRSCPYGDTTAQALDRYARVRARHQGARSPALWLAVKGRMPLTDAGVAHLVKRRGEQAGIEGLHAHLFRHRFAHSWLASGGQEQDLMRLAGWRSREMLGRYGASAADARAHAAYRDHSPLDHL
jgi:site-specific recombinase XerD